MAEVIPVASASRRRQFVAFPHRLYRGETNYVPQPNFLQRQLLSPRGNPFLRHSEIALFLAVVSEEVVGRIAAIHNRAHLAAHGDGTGFFGLFDSIDDGHVAGALLRAAAAWLRARDLASMIGPENLTTNDSVGVLTGGFEHAPLFFMPYNYPYYPDLIASVGLKPVMELFAYRLSHEDLPVDIEAKAGRLETRLRVRGVVIRPLRFDRFADEIRALRQAYNAANAGNWGFVPLDEATFAHMATDLRPLLDPDSVWVAEEGGRLVGFAVCVPDYNQVFRKIKDGKLLPFAWRHLLTARRTVTRFRVMILGVLPSHRGRGIDWCLYARVAEHTRRRGMAWGEAAYVMESNTAMNAMIRALGGRPVKTYRLYGGELAGLL